MMSLSLLIIRLATNLATSSSTGFPVSKTEDRRLFANTFEDTSVKMVRSKEAENAS